MREGIIFLKALVGKQVVQENIRRNEISEKITAKSYWVDYEFTYFLGIARRIAFYWQFKKKLQWILLHEK